MAVRTEQAPNTRLPAIQFPIGWITGNPVLLEIFAKALWALVPLQYYVLTRLPGGLNYSDYVPVAVVALAWVLVVFVISSAIGLIHPRDRGQQARAWGIALLLTWGASLGLLAFAYAVGPVLYGDTDDVISHYLCLNWGCPNYPDFGWKTFLIYFVYSVLAIVVILPVIYLLKREFASKEKITAKAEQMATFNPNLLIVAFVNAAVMTVINTVTTY